MATRRVLVGVIVLLALLSLGAGCTLRPSVGGPVTTGTPPPVTPASTGAGGAEETPSPVATTVQTTMTAITSATTAAPTETQTPTSTPTATATPAPDETAPIAEMTVPTLAPLPESTGTGTIAELASADPELSRFVQALRQGGIYETLNGTGTYTVFAPNNAAFDTVPPGTLTRLLLDRNALTAVADYHVIYGRWLSVDLARESSIATRSGVPLSVTVLPDGGLQVDGARVIRADIVATNGVLHVIDRVMIPPGTP